MNVQKLVRNAVYKFYLGPERRLPKSVKEVVDNIRKDYYNLNRRITDVKNSATQER